LYQHLISVFFLCFFITSNLRGFKSFYQNLFLQSHIVSIVTRTYREHYFFENAKIYWAWANISFDDAWMEWLSEILQGDGSLI